MKIKIKADNCRACGICLDSCNHNAIRFSKILDVYQINQKACVGCGSCYEENHKDCPGEAFEIVKKK